MGLVDPAYIYPDVTVAKTIDCYYTRKGRRLRERLQLNQPKLQPIEEVTPTMASLGEVLRRTRTLYSYDHASNVLKEAAISGCEVLVLHDDGQLLIRKPAAAPTISIGSRVTGRITSGGSGVCSFVRDFVRELITRWEVPTSVAQGARCW